MVDFTKFVYTPAGFADATLAICATRAGGVGILNGELTSNLPALLDALERLATNTRAPYGVKLDTLSDSLCAAVRAYAQQGLRWLIIDAEILGDCATLIAEVRGAGVRVLAEITSAEWADSPLTRLADGLMLKGNEAGGFVGEDSSFILLQKCRQLTRLPLYVRGGITPHVAAACAAIGVAGGALDSQLLLMDEAALPDTLRTLIGNLSGSETLAVGHGETGEYFRLLVRPSLGAARQFAVEGDGLHYEELRQRVIGRTLWQEPSHALLPIGQDVAFAAPWCKRFGSVAAVLQAIDLAVQGHASIAHQCRSIAAGAPLARALGLRFPIIQGPMTRVSDTAEFALAIAAGGALPMVAFAVMKGPPLEELLKRTAELLGKRPWGIGLLGFAPQELLDEQLAIAARFAPNYAIIAGGRPDQALQLEKAGVPTFLHVPSATYSRAVSAVGTSGHYRASCCGVRSSIAC
jgi:NAD(P)H-dependent flavin oxidoreductase YrpB (nitropropane dioxygenase family)